MHLQCSQPGTLCLLCIHLASPCRCIQALHSIFWQAVALRKTSGGPVRWFPDKHSCLTGNVGIQSTCMPMLLSLQSLVVLMIKAVRARLPLEWLCSWT